MVSNLRWHLRRRIEVAWMRMVEGCTRLVVWLLPRAQVYDALVGLSGLLDSLTGDLYRRLRRAAPARDYRALLLRDMLCMATRKGGIPIRTQLRGGEIFDRVYAAHGHAILCTAHFGLTLAMFSVLEARNLVPAAVGQVSAKRDRLHWGCRNPVNLIESDRLCLVRARRALEAGQVVLVFPDVPRSPANIPDTGDVGLDVEPNCFDFAGLVGAPLLFFSAELGQDGAIVMEIVEPEHSVPGSPADCEALAQEFCAFLAPRMGRPCRVAPHDRPSPLRLQRAN